MGRRCQLTVRAGALLPVRMAVVWPALGWAPEPAVGRAREVEPARALGPARVSDPGRDPAWGRGAGRLGDP